VALPSSGAISIKDVFNETYTDDYTDGDEPTGTQVGIGYSSLTTLSDWADNGQGGGGLAAWTTYSGNGSAPHSLSEFHGGNRGSGSGGFPRT